MQFNPSEFTVSEPKSIPVVLLLDISYSMQGEKIEILNQSVEAMIKTFQQAETMETFIKVSIITFGAGVDLAIPLTEASKIEFKHLSVNGSTPMGTAFKMAKAMIEDKEIIVGRDYRPAVILVSDGQPTDDWEAPLSNFINDGRSQKCDRMALAIGKDANQSVLKKFINGCENPLFFAEDAENIIENFKKITLSVTQRTKSIDPNKSININEAIEGNDIDLDDLDGLDI